nr:DinB family protein [Virgisporangium ochraceum]
MVSTAGERETLERFLDHHRYVLRGKLRDLPDADGRRQLVGSETTLLGLLRHVAAVERNWFQHILAGRPREQIAGNSRGDDASWVLPRNETAVNVLAAHEAACAESRRIAAGFDLDHTVPHERLGRVSLRWVFVHLIREYARHAGHADILREQLDGVTGD